MKCLYGKGLFATLTAGALLLVGGCSGKAPAPAVSTPTPAVKTELDIAYDENSVLTVETEQQSDMFHYRYIYDLSYLDDVLGYQSVSREQVLRAVEDSALISDKFKALLETYVNAVAEHYPDADLRVFYENLKTMAVHECTKDELVLKSLSFDSLGVYMKDENAIYVLKDYEYQPNTWPYQIIFHEFSHALKGGRWELDGEEVKVLFDSTPGGTGTVPEEALNSIFAVSLYDKDERDIAYQLQSNYFLLLLSCLDNYTLTDYINRDYSYFLSCLDEYNQDQNYAAYIMALISAQYEDFHDDKQRIRQSEFYPIYDYVLGMYFRKNILPGMTYDEAKAAADAAISTITFDVSEEYRLDTAYMYDFFAQYCAGIGIAIS